VPITAEIIPNEPGQVMLLRECVTRYFAELVEAILKKLINNNKE
jgi:hypothetical protein